MSIRLEPINKENWYECSQLAVTPAQSAFISSNLLCIAEVQFYPTWGAFAVYADAQMVGFVMYEDDYEQEAWWISSLMISADQQGKGYGKAAVAALLPLLRKRGCQEIWVGYADDNLAARALYRAVGFREFGLDEDGDMTAHLRLDQA